MRFRHLWWLLLLVAAIGLVLSGVLDPGSDAETGVLEGGDAADAASEDRDPRAGRSAAGAQRKTPIQPPRTGERPRQPVANSILSGRAFDPQTKSAIADAIVTVQLASSPPSVVREQQPEASGTRHARTDNRGEFRLPFRFVPGESYWVRAARDGYFTCVRLLDDKNVVPKGTGWEAASFDVALTATASAAGVVGRAVDARGAPATGLRVQLRAGIGDLPELGVPHEFAAQADGRGHFEVSSVCPGKARLSLACDGHAKLVRDLTLMPRQRVDLGTLRLRAVASTGDADRASLTGTVLEADGTTVPGARVRIDPQRRGELRADVAEDGAFRIDGIRAGQRRLLVEVPKRPSLSLAHEFEPREAAVLHIRLPSWKHFLGGTVVDVDDRREPVPDLEVTCHARHDSHRESSVRGGTLRWVTRTDRRGRFRLEGLPAGPIDISLSWEDGAYRDLRVRGLVVDRDDHVLRFPLPRGVRITGLVTDADGGPIAGAQIAPTYGKLDKHRAARCRTAADGRYSILVPLTNQQAIPIRAQKTGFVPAERSFRLVAANRERVVAWDVTLHRASDLASVTGRVRDARGVAIEGARCRVDFPRSRRTRSAVTDAQGRYRISGLPPGAGELQIDHDSFRRFSRTLKVERSGRHTVDAALERMQTADVRIVLRRDGQALAGQPVTVYCRHPRRHETRRTAADGSVVLEKWPRVESRVWIRESRQNLSQSGIFDLAKRELDPLRLEVRRGAGVIHGVLVTPAGNPLPAELVACHEADGAGLRIHSEVATDRDGRFRFENLPLGTYAIDVAGDARHRVQARTGGPSVKLVFLR